MRGRELFDKTSYINPSESLGRPRFKRNDFFARDEAAKVSQLNYCSFLWQNALQFHGDNTRWGGHLFRRLCSKFSESSPCLLGQQCSCSTAQQPGELSKNILQNLSEQVAAPPGRVPGPYLRWIGEGKLHLSFHQQGFSDA